MTIGIRLERLVRGAHRRGRHLAVADQLHDALPLRGVVFHDQQPLDASLEESLDRLQGIGEPALIDRLAEHGDRAVFQAAPLG